MNELIIPENQEYPINILVDIPKYEELNNVKINVWEIKNDIIDILYSNTLERREEVINTLVITEGDESHFTWIKIISSLFASKTIEDKKYMYQQCLAFKSNSQDGLNKLNLICPTARCSY